ncbi:MAG: GTPase [Deltaproteobacteria bacterium]|nr:GTPase [Deltaproteobacteria bacterium]
MPTYNYKARELIAKIVYYGPGRCGKTTNLQQIHAKMRPETRSDLLSVATETDRTIYFDLLPLNLGTINGMKFMVRLFTVPGQVYYSETRKLVLRGTDGVVFVADSQDHMMDENRESLRDLKANLEANGIDYQSIPLVLQYNKRDLPRLISEAELDATLNDRGVKAMGSVASQGVGVLETLRFVTVAVFNHIKSGTSAQAGLGGSQPVAPRSRAPSARNEAPAPVSAPASFGAPPEHPAPVAPLAPMTASAPSAAHARPGASRAAALEAALATARSAGRASTGAAAALPSLSSGSLPPAGGWSQPRNGPLPPPPATLGAEVLFEEFKSLALMHSQLAERLTTIEQEVKRLGRENQEIRERLAHHND